MTRADDFSSLFEFLPIGAYRSSPEGRQLRANPALVQLNGFASEAEQLAEVSQIATEWYVDPGRRDEFKHLLERDGRVAGFESEVYRYKSRERIWIRENAHVVRDATGAVLFYEGTVEEITERIRDRQALQRSQQQLRQVVDLVPGMVYRVVVLPGHGRRATLVSSGVQALFGLTQEEVMTDGLAVHRLRHPGDRARVEVETQAAIGSGATWESEFRVVLRSGEEKWVQAISTAAPPEDGQEVRVGVAFDITARKLAEDRLRESSELWKRALESSGDGVWDWHIEDDVEILSAACKALYGFAEDELPDRPDALDSRTHPNDLEGMHRAREAHFSGLTPSYVSEHRVQCKDGQWKWILSRGIVISRDTQGRPLRMIGTHTDITAKKQAEELRLERDRAEAADMAKSHFLSRVSHELRTPLNAVLGFSQLLEMEADLAANPRQLGWVRQVLASGRHLLALMDDILDLSAAQTGQLSVHAEAMPLRPVVEEAWAMLASAAQEAGLQFEDEVRTELTPQVLADRKRLKQVLVNLLSNAIKYNRPGGWVRVGAVRLGDEVVLSVTDSGVGLSEAQSLRLFQPFERLGAERGPVPGTGLGLALCRQLIEAMNGSIDASSRPGEGSIFRIRLPRA
jgi:PAS domain S-box-containing protein